MPRAPFYSVKIIPAVLKSRFELQNLGYDATHMDRPLSVYFASVGAASEMSTDLSVNQISIFFSEFAPDTDSHMQTTINSFRLNAILTMWHLLTIDVVEILTKATIDVEQI